MKPVDPMEIRGKTRVPVTLAASYLHMSPRTLSKGLQKGAFPFGTAFEEDKRWVYVIPGDRLMAWVRGADLAADGEVNTNAD